ncbi:DUF4259 domain-containing protein [Micromonospora sp. NBC_01813]|uniref:DUF4259 domain-containing protein n=1 Tax=Micromonospora sp. NBC_01813 TaxID=2975988 RepID=UPI002DD9E01F|nr:DUF4259 domain-containing protein [Micromonospora sp. NBC_01813]WSA08141.1 DUF4259 domain-containing protein [Micromonospora sp. NBC_01813]
MATWQFGPFDNDEAVEWCAALEATEPDLRAELVRATLAMASSSAGTLTGDEAARAVAAAAVVLQMVTGRPVSKSAYSPQLVGEDVQVGPEVRHLAVRALDVVLAVGSVWRQLWHDDVEEDEAIAVVETLRRALLSSGRHPA